MAAGPQVSPSVYLRTNLRSHLVLSGATQPGVVIGWLAGSDKVGNWIITVPI